MSGRSVPWILDIMEVHFRDRDTQQYGFNQCAAQPRLPDRLALKRRAQLQSAARKFVSEPTQGARFGRVLHDVVFPSDRCEAKARRLSRW